MYQGFVIQWCPRFNVLNLVIQNEDFAEFWVSKKPDFGKRTTTTSQRRKPPNRHSNSLEKMGDTLLPPVHGFSKDNS
jgi:hypothetical protein